MKLYITVDL